MTIFTGLVIAGLIIVIYPDYIRTNSMISYPVEDKAYSDTIEYSPYAVYLNIFLQELIMKKGIRA
ncbi:MAG: hypothetical protein LBK94_08875 [Prevotellaceae bacterium]|jgi:hypothetical protein|nr:hypothetical protein [Prevotellaceae bacterium]